MQVKFCHICLQFISSFKIGKDDFLVGAVRYNREVDARGEIALGSLDNLRSLQHAITYLQQGGRGKYYVYFQQIVYSIGRKWHADLVCLSLLRIFRYYLHFI